MNQVALFSREWELELKRDLLATVGRFLELQSKPQQRLTGLISRQQAMTELGIKKVQTFRDWEKLGLKPYHPPMEDTRTIFYKVSDLLEFLGAEDEQV